MEANKVKAEMVNILSWLKREPWYEWSAKDAEARIAAQWMVRGYDAFDALTLARATMDIHINA